MSVATVAQINGSKSSTQQFTPPGYTSTYACLVDLIRFGPECLRGATFLAMLFLVERTVTWKKLSDRCNYDQIVNGITQKDEARTVVRMGSGLSKAGAADAFKVLEGKGLIKRTQHSNQQYGKTATEYTPDTEKLTEFFAKVRTGRDVPLKYKKNKDVHPADKACPLSRHTSGDRTSKKNAHVHSADMGRHRWQITYKTARLFCLDAYHDLTPLQEAAYVVWRYGVTSLSLYQLSLLANAEQGTESTNYRDRLVKRTLARYSEPVGAPQ